MKSAAEIIDQLRTQSGNRRKLEALVSSLRCRTKRSVYGAVFSFLTSVSLAYFALQDGVVGDIDGKQIILFPGFFALVGAVIMFFGGLRDLWINPGDRLLLLLSEDYFARLKQSEEESLNEGATPDSDQLP